MFFNAVSIQDEAIMTSTNYLSLLSVPYILGKEWFFVASSSF